MLIPETTWVKYIEDLRAINTAAAEQVSEYIAKHPIETAEQRKLFLDFCYGISAKYGEGAASLACEMYDAMGLLSGVKIPPAAPAETSAYGEVAKTVNGALKFSQDVEVIGAAVGRLVKRTGVDTTMQNAIRDGAEWAWVAHGDTCPFCIALASQGWQRASKKALKDGHAEHIHNNCDCTYAVRFNEKTEIEGYNPDEYYEMYHNADGRTSEEKLNSMRREAYEQNKDRINEQKREWYDKNKEKIAAQRKAKRELNSSKAEEIDIR